MSNHSVNIAVQGLLSSDREPRTHQLLMFIFLLQLHMVHWNSTLYPSLEEALGKPHGVSIIAIFIQVRFLFMSVSPC